MSDLSDPFSEEYADDPDADLRLWSCLPTPVLRLAEVSLIHACHQARSVGRSACRKHVRVVSVSVSLSFLPLIAMMNIPQSVMLNAFVFQSLNIIVTSVQNHRSTLREFSERFKYDVISSSLLSSSITAPSSTRRRSYSDDSVSHDPDLATRTWPSPPPAAHSPIHRRPVWPLVPIFLCLVSPSFGFFLLCIFIGAVLYYVESYTINSGNLTEFMTPVGALPYHCIHTLT
jgi:hypothetical protein